MKIAVMGVGGMGGFFGGRFARAGLAVALIARGDHLRAIRESGLQVRSVYGDFTAASVSATDNPAEVGAVDLVFFCVKAYDTLSAAEAMRPLVGAQTVIIPTLNGIDHIATLSAHFGAEHVLGGVATVSAHRAAPGVIQHNGRLQRLEFGEIGGGMSARVEALYRTLSVAGLDLSADANIMLRMWWKLAYICGAGVFSAVRGSKAMIWGTPEVRELFRRAVAEVVAVAHAKGIPLADSVPADCLTLMESFPPAYKPSMLQDLERGGRLEVEALNGSVSRLGKELGVPTPANDFIYACLKPYVNGAPPQG